MTDCKIRCYKFLFHSDLFPYCRDVGTTVTLNGTNYLLGTSFLRLYRCSELIGHLLEPPFAITDSTHETWLSCDYCVITWLLNSLEEKINGSVIFLSTAKEMRDTLKIMYENENNLSRVF